jgi:hypothetical protein
VTPAENVIAWLRAWSPPVVWRTAQRLRARARYGRLPTWELPCRRISDLWPAANEAEVALIPKQMRQHLWGMPEHELLILGAITRAVSPERIVEFGTFTGASTLTIALNSPPNARVVTVDVDPATRPTHVHGLGVGLVEFRTGEMFLNTPWAAKIEQRYCDTRQFAMPAWKGQVALFMVDADHTYEFVRTDTAIAKSMLSPGGIIVWHDYTWTPDSAECAGVTRAVNEFNRQYGNCFQIAGTRFAIHLPDHGM